MGSLPVTTRRGWPPAQDGAQGRPSSIPAPRARDQGVGRRGLLPTWRRRPAASAAPGCLRAPASARAKPGPPDYRRREEPSASTAERPTRDPRQRPRPGRIPGPPCCHRRAPGVSGHARPGANAVNPRAGRSRRCSLTQRRTTQPRTLERSGDRRRRSGFRETQRMRSRVAVRWAGC
ncbi:uncharacterized protein LOC116539151 [Sapajus apella]|uniref:Uncharacterized protein LOC116539151 n=1 Tax=Sapajus apella TaxID=9515 RepID=A0A6J3GIB9_SAPAP|nr:uncharacterized protein LOC116539151 [Sapajus apella]